MAQLEDKPAMHPHAYITEVESDSDVNGELKDAQYDDQVMVYPKWHETSDNLVPKPTLMDAVALTRTGYPKSTAGDVTGLENDVFTTTAEQWGQASTSTSWSSTNRYNIARSSSVPGDGGSTSTLEDEFDDWAKLITTELTELDRDIVKFVATGGEISQLPDASLEVLLNGDSLDGLQTNEAIQNLVTPKIEEIPMDSEENGISSVNLVNIQNMPPPRVPSGGYGNLPTDNFAGDTKPNLISINQEGDLLETGLGITGSKIRRINSPCMFGSGNSTSERNYQQKAPTLSHLNSGGPSNAVMMNISQQTQNHPTGRDSNGMNFERIPQMQQADMTSTGGGNFRVPAPVSQMQKQKDAVHSQFFPILKEAFPNVSDDTVADLIDDMIQDSDRRQAEAMRMATLLQQAGFAQLEEVPEIEIKQEVVTPTLPQPTSSFPSFSDSVATQSSQPQVISGSASSFSSTDTFNQLPGNHVTFVAPPRRPQNGTVHSQNPPMRFQNGNSQFESQGDSNMNFLHSFSTTETSPQAGVPIQGDNLWNPDPPLKQSVMDQGIRNLLQSTGNPLPNQTTNLNSQVNSGLLPQQSNMQFVPQSLSNMLPQNGSRNSQSNMFNMTVVPNVDQLNLQEPSHVNSLLQSGAPLQALSFQNLNGASMSIANQHYPKFDVSRKL
ncbi:uncharacterized protein LOC110039842 [Orbicella faveolata]|nr:uncharacterized protein LOC110039842 [Orbicella faveolata]